MRLIDADELLQDNTWEWFDEWGNYTQAGKAIANAPTVDAEPVRHGKWNEKTYADIDGYVTGYECSECGRFEDATEPYCHCGAKMEVTE